MALRPTTFAQSLELLAAIRDQRPDPANEQLAFTKFCFNNVAWSHGQFMQDLWVAYELKGQRGGYFVEFGGTNGVKFSNTYALETRLGWNGVVAEPARVWYPDIRNNRRCAVDDRCVWTVSGEQITFNQPVIAAHSTIDAYSDSDMHGHTRVDGQRYEVETVSLNDLLAHWQAPPVIDYLSIDTEGSELDILKAFNFEAHRIRLISVEHNHTPQRQALYDFLTDKGYRRKFEKLSSVDDWYVLAD